MSKADAVENHGQKLFAATENLLMPMVQFGFLFPVVLTAIFSTKFNNKHDNNLSNPLENSTDYERTVRAFFPDISQIFCQIGQIGRILIVGYLGVFMVAF